MLLSYPQGIVPVYHPSGDIRQAQLKDGVASGYGTSLFSGTPVKFTTDGTLIATGTGADVMSGIFAGCQFTTAQRRVILPYWPASQTYDAGSMIAFYQPIDTQAIYEGETAATVAATVVGEAINLDDTSQGSIYTGQSTQQLSATTGATPGLFIIVGLAEYPNNAWGDPYVRLRLRIGSPQGPVA
ncbi:MAG: hypothetical protein WC829_05790 [Hyphomicrobium sp.]|jgi:hypothetical protein